MALRAACSGIINTRLHTPCCSASRTSCRWRVKIPTVLPPHHHHCGLSEIVPSSQKKKMMRTKDPTYPPPKSSSGKGGQGSGRGGTGKKGDNSNTSKRNQPDTRGKRESPGNEQLNRGELRLENFDWDSFEVGGVLGEGRSGRVFEGTLRGERVVVKLSDLWQHPELHEEILREARTYVELGKLDRKSVV